MHRITRQTVLSFAIGMLWTTAVHATEGPTRPNSIIFNHTIPVESGTQVSLPLYFTRRGLYFGEVLFEYPGKASAKPGSLNYSIAVFRRGEQIFARDYQHELTPAKRGATLFRVNTDRELPLKTKLDLVVSFDEATAAELDSGPEALTFQIRLKPNMTGRF